MWLIEKSAGEAIQFVAVYVDGPIGHSQEDAEKLANELTKVMNAKHGQFVEIERLDEAFHTAENMTATHFNSQTCSMLSVDDKHECPICYFRISVKQLLGIKIAGVSSI